MDDHVTTRHHERRSGKANVYIAKHMYNNVTFQHTMTYTLRCADLANKALTIVFAVRILAVWPMLPELLEAVERGQQRCCWLRCEVALQPCLRHSTYSAMLPTLADL